MAKVVGVPGGNGGTIAVAFVVPYGPDRPGEDELKQWCAQTLAKFKVPSRFILSADPLPRLGTGKIDRQKLKARYAS
jgi:acyl-CoA synthetase (AMP-forming)/AMP-acid ligase II